MPEATRSANQHTSHAAALGNPDIEALIQARNLPAARQAARQRCKNTPTDADAVFYLAACHMVERQFGKAQKLFAKAAKLHPDMARFVAAQAAAALADNRTEEALNIAEKALLLDETDLATRITLLQAMVRLRQFVQAMPHAEYLTQHHVEILETRQLMGEVLRGMGRHQAALTWFEAALELAPEDVRPKIDIATCVNHLGDVRSAIKMVQTVIDDLPPDEPDIYSRLGIRAQEAGSPHLALQFFKKGTSLFSDDVTLNVNLGITLQHMGQTGEALFYFQRALKLDDSQAPTWYFAANSHLALKNQPAAETALEKCIQIDPKHSQALTQLASLKKEKNQIDAAKELLEKAIKNDPHWLQPYLNLHHFLKENDDLDGAERILKQAKKVAPNSQDIRQCQASLWLKKGEITKANKEFREILKNESQNPDAMSGLLFCSNYDPESSPQEIANNYFEWDRRFIKWRAPDQNYKYANKATQRRKLKIGYVSGDFKGHSVAFFFEPMLANHNHQQFEIYCYSNFKGADATTQRMMGMADHWRWIHDLSDDAVVEMIRLDEIDILIDLSNHTAFHRLYMFGRRPAPIQMTTIGMPTTTGLSSIDWRITDKWMDPVGLTEDFHSEKLLRILSGWCYRPSDEALQIPVADLPALKNQHLSFASFNAFGKINPKVLKVWGRLLNAIPDAVLYIATGGKENDEELNIRVKKTCSKCGIPAGRLILLPRKPMKEYFEFHNEVDVVLDAFPYTGATVTAHALWMGVPVITLAGPNSIHRSATSMMHAVGLPEFVANTEEDYITIAKDISTNIKKLAKTRQNLRSKMQRSPLMDGKSVTADLEKKLRAVWIEWCKLQQPQQKES